MDGLSNGGYQLNDLWGHVRMHFFQGEISLPSQSEMEKDVKDYRDRLSKEFLQTLRHTIQVNLPEYARFMAKEIGCAPDLGKLFLLQT